MKRTAGFWFGGAALVVVGVVVGVMITANYDLTPTSKAQEDVSISLSPAAAAGLASPFGDVADGQQVPARPPAAESGKEHRQLGGQLEELGE